MKSHHWINRLLCLFIAALFSLSISQLGYAGEIKPGSNKPVPDIRWQDTEGNTHHLKDSDGKPRLLHFWAAWCFPCRAELPEMLEWIEKNKDIEIIPLSLDERMAQAKYFIKKYKLDMSPLLINDEDSGKLNIPALPYTIFISADGRQTGNLYGAASWDDEFTTQLKKHFNID